MACAGCDKPILDKFLLKVLERAWHAACVRCVDCREPLTDKCFSREAKLFCRNDFFRRYGTKCGGCGDGISPSELVRKAREIVFHLNCFTCLVCRKQLSTGEELYVLADNKFICKKDFLEGKAPPLHHADSVIGSDEEDDDDDEAGGPKGPSSLSPGALPHPSDLAMNSDSKTGQDDSEDQGSLDGDPETRDSQAENKSPDDGNGGSKRRGPRTTIKAKQLEILKTAFSQTPKPTRHIREQLAKETGLPMRVIQAEEVCTGPGPYPARPAGWVQAGVVSKQTLKERRLKQLTSMGRGPFFGSSRKMRGFPMNLSPGGLDEAAAAGFPYFATADGKFEFGYGGPPFHGHDAPFFPAHHPGPPPMPFGQQGGGPMDHSMPMGFEPGSLDGPGGFLGQGGGPPPDHLLSGIPRGSPDFLPQPSFAEGPPMHGNEGLVW